MYVHTLELPKLENRQFFDVKEEKTVSIITSMPMFDHRDAQNVPRTVDDVFGWPETRYHCYLKA